MKIEEITDVQQALWIGFDFSDAAFLLGVEDTALLAIIIACVNFGLIGSA